MTLGSADLGACRPRLRFPPGLAADPRLALYPPHLARTSHLSPQQPISEPREGTSGEISHRLQVPHSEGSSLVREMLARGQREGEERERRARGEEDGMSGSRRAAAGAAGGRTEARQQQQPPAAPHIAAAAKTGTACVLEGVEEPSPNCDDAPKDRGQGEMCYAEVWRAECIWDGSRRMVTYVGKIFASCASRVRRKRDTHTPAPPPP